MLLAMDVKKALEKLKTSPKTVNPTQKVRFVHERIYQDPIPPK